MTTTLLRRIYRKARNSNVWHWCRNCSRWPTTEFVEQEGLPFTGELCFECKSKQEMQSCQ